MKEAANWGRPLNALHKKSTINPGWWLRTGIRSIILITNSAAILRLVQREPPCGDGGGDDGDDGGDAWQVQPLERLQREPQLAMSVPERAPALLQCKPSQQPHPIGS
jgi:hypothetical protein